MPRIVIKNLNTGIGTYMGVGIFIICKNFSNTFELYLTLVRPNLEYGQIISKPIHIKDNNS